MIDVSTYTVMQSFYVFCNEYFKKHIFPVFIISAGKGLTGEITQFN